MRETRTLHALARLVLAVSVAVSAPPVSADVVTERWGNGRCRHAGTAGVSSVPDGGFLVHFDLSALPRGAEVLRARFLPHLHIEGIPLAAPVVVRVAAAPQGGQGAPRPAGDALLLEAPRFLSFDATAVVRRWASGGLENQGLLVSGAPVDRSRVELEVTYVGKLTDPPTPATDLRVFWRAGQVFLTWKEAKSPFQGKGVVLWEDLEAEQKRIRGGQEPVVTYRIYRHAKPITAETLAEARWIDEVPQHSAFDEREILTEWKGEQIKNVRVRDAPVPRTAVEEKIELAAGTGVFVRTCRDQGTFYYAVVSTADGVENTIALDAGNSSGPIEEKVSPTEPILFRVQPLQYQKRDQYCYIWWIDPPLWNLPHFVHLSVAPPQKTPPGPGPLFVYNGWWGSGWNRATQCPMEEAVVFTIDQNCMQTRGVHDGCGTYKAWINGIVQGYFVRQFRALLPWMVRRYAVDEDRVFALSSGWAWHYPDLFAAAFESTSMNPRRSPAAMECKRYFGDPRQPAPTEWGVSAWDYWDSGRWIADNPTVELPLITYSPCMHTGDFGILDKPPLYRALLDTKRAWSATFEEGTTIGHLSPSWMFELRRTDSLAAFGNCSLDDDPGIGLGWDPGGQMNGWLCFDPRSSVDRPNRWEMTVYLHAGGERGRSGAPLDRCTVDVTPRRCRAFKAHPGDRFAWTNTSLADGKVIQSGTAAADRWGLVTAEKVMVSKGRNRLVIERASAAAAPATSEIIPFRQGVSPAPSYSGCRDTWISDEDWEKNADKGASERLRTGGRRAILIRFDLSPIPAGTTVHRAVLRLADAGYPRARPEAHRHTLKAFVLARDWKADANWREHTRTRWETPDVGDWASPGGDLHADADLDLGEMGLAAKGELFAGPWGHLHELDVTHVVRKWLSGALANHGLLLRSDAMVEIASSEWPVAEGRPVLLIDIDAGETPAGITPLTNPPAEITLDPVSATADSGTRQGEYRTVQLSLGRGSRDACTYIKENAERFPGTWNWLDHCRVGGAAGDVNRTLLRFDLSELPSNASIREALLVCSLEPRTSHLGSGYRYGAFLVRLPDSPGWSEDATATQRKPGTPWPAGGARAAAGDSPVAVGDIIRKEGEVRGERRTVGAEIRFDLTGAVRAWLSGRVPNSGILLDHRIEGGAYDIYSSRAEPALRPRLELMISPAIAVEPPAAVEPALPPPGYWIEPMREVHRRFKGTPGTLAQYGDSITVTMAFLAPYSWSGKIDAKNVNSDLRRRLDLVEQHADLRLWREWKGGEWGCTGMMRSDWLFNNIAGWQKKMEPEVAVVLFGTNDLGSLLPPDYTENMAASLRCMMATGTLPLLTSIPPASRGGHCEYWLAALSIARGLRVPLIDYYSEILRRRPDDWNGALDQFKGHGGDEYQVPTLISGDGTHPSNPREWQNDFGEEALSRNGYTLRNYLTITAYAEVIEKVLRR